ncbi:FKBP-type peptidyl-prolyl cis-trans isomerase [Bacteroides sp. 224]|uniref:FKBP-type peptidyl-prolyl cis-trans isomerase n=1 Tax=Bacteroides sp. 224 TaxID=2302936 RepID=UPI0013D79D7F|nr:FKBP-type peptidyl-prolyl cis-trans isomerase [Bacteroides sp. 224]NDV63732.1 FKBP-type peptidyl-prolyl cis-trans isomerase [Bacteroides sp. 224]
MKKLSILLVIAVAIGMAACTAQPKANLKNDVDTLFYAFGMSRTEGIEQHLLQQGVDTAFMSAFIAGFSEGVNCSEEEMARLEGKKIGFMVSKYWVDGFSNEVFSGDSSKFSSTNRDNMLAGFIDGLKNKGVMNTADAQAYTQAAMEKVKEKALLETHGENKEAGEKFLAENKDKEGVVTTESGLQYKVITEGKGEVPAATDRVKVNYKGTLIDGTEFDSSYSRNEPATFAANQVIKGWTEALTMMPVGSKWELYIPQDLAYGSREQRQIKPFSTLVFEVELLEIVK